ncbi:hypothetical protein QCA50_004611 [Cerrena zonata]|uniref:FAD-binding domain-containing protein n=1 Tax=Cerrena zonata TaxID=2478898 RepID=A0AAW0GI65_9APHY
MSQPATKVIIAGCGIAGPVLAVFLLKQGYTPIIYERLESFTETGIGLCLQVNGLRILSKIPGLVESIEGGHLERMLFHSVLPEDEGLLADFTFPSQPKEKVGMALGVRRPAFHRRLIDMAIAHGIQVVWGHQVTGLEQHSDSVTVTFQNGKTDTASFVVGCDGIHSDTRACLFGKEPADFTGLVQIGGVSPKPSGYPFEKLTMMNVFGNGEHFITYSVDDTHNSWAVTLREPEAKETWRAMDQESQEDFKQHSPFASWGVGAGELIRNATKIVKYGLYDRPQLKSWHVGRVVLLGDAAHPTSPHLGQGANQAFEDIAYLTNLLEKYNPQAQQPSTDLLEKIFTEYEETRIPRTAALVAEARKQGDLRVASGVDACKQRNQIYHEMWGDEEVVKKRYAALLDHNEK